MRLRTSAGTQPARHRGRKGFSLQEMLVICGIIAVLVALIAPTLTSIQEVRRRTVCTTNNMGFAKLCIYYATAQGAIARDPRMRLALPIGRVDDPEDWTDKDNYVKMSDSAFQVLNDKYGLEKEQAMCASLPPTVVPGADNSPLFNVAVGMADGLTPMPAVYMGLIYWGGREHIYPPGSGDPPPPPDPRDEPLYYSYRTQDLHKDMFPSTDSGTPEDDTDDLAEEWYEYSPTSNTLVTCMMFDANANETGADLDLDGNGLTNIMDCPENVSIMPHSGRRFRTYGPGSPPDELSEGIVVGYTDGAAKWVSIEDLVPIDQYQRIWYDPQ